jgi:hypothetical protein
MAHFPGRYCRPEPALPLQDQPARVLELHQRNLTDYERVHGPDRSHTLNARANLASCYRALGDLARAIARTSSPSPTTPASSAPTIQRPSPRAATSHTPTSWQTITVTPSPSTSKSSPTANGCTAQTTTTPDWPASSSPQPSGRHLHSSQRRTRTTGRSRSNNSTSAVQRDGPRGRAH